MALARSVSLPLGKEALLGLVGKLLQLEDNVNERE